MPKRSQFEDLKPEILAEFQIGKQPKDLYGKFPQIPPKTIRNWFKSRLPLNSPHAENQLGENVSSLTPPNGASQRSHLTLIPNESDEDDSLTDIQWVKRQIKAILRVEKNCAVKIQGLNTFLRAVQLESSLRPAKLDIDLSELSDQDLERLAAGEPLEAIAQSAANSS